MIRDRDATRGRRGAVSSAHPLASEAAAEVLAAGGNAVDAAVGAQAAICVLMPQAASLGGDLLTLVRRPDGVTLAVNGTGASAIDARPGPWLTGANSVTTPGLVAGWESTHRRFGGIPLTAVLAPAIRLARAGIVVDHTLAQAVDEQRSRLVDGGAGDWALLRMRPGDRWRQPELAELLGSLAEDGPQSFYQGGCAAAIVSAVHRHAGRLGTADLANHRTDVKQPMSVAWGRAVAHVQPPMSQGVLLAMALHYLDERAGPFGNGPALLDDLDEDAWAHLLVELTEATFAHRSDCAAGEALLEQALDVDPDRAANRGGPRAYLHTAGVATADAAGLVVSSLVSVFDDFGSGVFVPELGFTLNNRAAGFTDGANAPAAGTKPVHTLAPVLVQGDQVIALATPGADGQVQTLLQILVAIRFRQLDLPDAVAALRWRTEEGSLLIEAGHPARTALEQRGHVVRDRAPGDPVFGGVVAAGVDEHGPFCVSDWRRQVSSLAV